MCCRWRDDLREGRRQEDTSQKRRTDDRGRLGIEIRQQPDQPQTSHCEEYGPRDSETAGETLLRPTFVVEERRYLAVP